MLDDYQWHFDYARLVRDTGFIFQIHRPKPSRSRNIEHIDIQEVLLHQDIELIDRNINTVLEFSLDNEQTSVLDPNFVKIFYISQLSVQYLLFCKKYLDNTVAHLKKEITAAKEQIHNFSSYTEQLQQEIISTKNELQTVLNCQAANAQNLPVFQCNRCPKAFSSEEYLLAHVQRRHENVVNGTLFQVETDKLQSEIKALKERLNNTEKYIHHSDDERPKNKATDNTSRSSTENLLLADLQHKFELLKMHVDNELRLLQTQKFDQGKYEQWFETFLNKLDGYNEKNSKFLGGGDVLTPRGINVCTVCPMKTTTGEKVSSPPTEKITKSDGTTQTDYVELSIAVCNKCDLNYQTHVSPQHLSGYYSDKELQPHFEKLGEIIQERVSGSIEKLESQMQSVCNKMNELEKQNFHVVKKDNTVHSHLESMDVRDMSQTDYKLNVINSLIDANDVQGTVSAQDVKEPKSTTCPKSPEIVKCKTETEIKVVPKPRKKWNTNAVYSGEKLNTTNSTIDAFADLSNVIAVGAVDGSINVDEDSSEKNDSSKISSNGDGKNEANCIDEKSKIIPQSKSSVISVTQKNPSTINIEDDSTKISSDSGSDIVTEENQQSILTRPKSTPIPTLRKKTFTSVNKEVIRPETYSSTQIEVENMLNQRLIELGVSPDWSSIPKDSYQRAIEIVIHQNSLVKKKYSNYKRINEEILRKVDNRMLGLKMKKRFSHDRILKSVGVSSTPSPTGKQSRTSIKQMEKNRPKPKTKMYESTSGTDSDDTLTNRKQMVWGKENILDQTQRKYFNVIQEFSKRNKPNLSPEIQIKPKIISNENDTKIEQAKSALKNYPSVGSLHKKKVLFNLQSSEGTPQHKPTELKANPSGSTSSIGSSIYGSKTSLVDSFHKTNNVWDVSDDDLSKIMK